MHFLPYNDVILKRNICKLLENIIKYSEDLVNIVINRLNPSKLLTCLNETDREIANNAVFCFCEIARKSFENAQKINANDGAAIIVEFIINVKGDVRLYCIMTLGYIANYKENLAIEIIDNKIQSN